MLSMKKSEFELWPNSSTMKRAEELHINPVLGIFPSSHRGVWKANVNWACEGFQTHFWHGTIRTQQLRSDANKVFTGVLDGVRCKQTEEMYAQLGAAKSKRCCFPGAVSTYASGMDNVSILTFIDSTQTFWLLVSLEAHVFGVTSVRPQWSWCRHLPI